MNGFVVEKWTVQTTEEIYIDELTDYIAVPEYIDGGCLDNSKAEFNNLIDKNNYDVAIQYVRKYNPCTRKYKGMVALVSFFKDRLQEIYVIPCESLRLDFDQIHQQIKRFDINASSEDCKNDFISIENDKSIRCYSRIGINMILNEASK